MKSQVAWNWKKSRTELVVTAQKNERVVLPEAEWLKDNPGAGLLTVEFDYARLESKHPTLHYDIMGLTKVKKMLKRKVLPTQTLTTMLEGLQQALHACRDAGFIMDKMLFDTNHVYVDERFRPHFVYVPLRGVRYDPMSNTPLVLLEALCNPKRMAFDSAEGERQRDALHMFVLREKVFSLNALSKLMRQEFVGIQDLDAPPDEHTPVLAEGRKMGQEAYAPYFMSDLFERDDVGTSTVRSYVLRREDTGEVFELPAGSSVTMGRSQSCDVSVRGNGYMGRRHLTLRVADGCAILTDLGSTNGTYAYHKRLKPEVPVRLAIGDRFLVGGEAFILLAQEA